MQKMESQPPNESVGSLDSARSFPTDTEFSCSLARVQQALEKDMNALKLSRKSSVRCYKSGKRENACSPFRGLKSLLAAPWGSGYRGPSDLPTQHNTTALKMTYFAVKQKIQHKEGNDLAMLTFQSAQKVNRCASVSGSSICGSSVNSCRTLQRSPGRKWLCDAGVITHDEQLMDMIRGLDDCRKKWENDGNYLEASAAAKRLHALKIFLEHKRSTTMLETHAKEKETAKAAYKAELEEKNRLWSERFKVFHDEVIQHAQALKQQHEITLQNFRSKMASRTPRKPQLSRELLNERRIQTFLGKQGKYLEAQQVKRHADRKEMKEYQSTLATYQVEVTLKEQALRAKQQTEMEILLQRAAQTRDELKKNKERDLKCCFQRHKNIMRDCEALHKQEWLKHQHKLARTIQEYRSLGGNIRYLSHALETLTVSALAELSGNEEAGSSILEVECMNI